MAISSLGGTYGLSGSGLDIDSLVKKLMTGQQAKEDALFQKKTVTQWQKDAYNTVYDDISNFRNTVFSSKLQANLSPNKVTSNAVSSSVVTATANSSAADVNHSLVVAQLAKGVNLTSAGAVSLTNPPTMGTLETQLGSIVPTSFTLVIKNGSTPSKSITINTQTDTINDVISKFNSAGVNVQASYDSTIDRFFLATTNTGASSGIDFTGSDSAGMSFLRDKLKLTSVVDATYASTPQVGQDAAFQLDGVNLTEASNTFSISGVTYNLTGNTTDGTLAYNNTTKTFSGTAGTATSISVTNDVDTAVANIQTLVDSYNKILAELNSKLSETRYSDYPPLTDAQKSAMKESDITLWNEKAKSGMLHNDATLRGLVNNLRNAFSSSVSGITGTHKNAASIGITTGDYTEGGKLYLDTDKLRTALQANPDVLNQLFGASGAMSGTAKIDTQSQGISGRLYDSIKTTMDKLKQIAGTTGNAQYDVSSNLAKSLTTYTTQISKAKETFNMMQSAYYKQFNALEVAIQKVNSQSSWMSSMLSTSSGN